MMRRFDPPERDGVAHYSYGEGSFLKKRKWLVCSARWAKVEIAIASMLFWALEFDLNRIYPAGWFLV